MNTITVGNVYCSLSEGMFETEYAVEIELIGGEKASLFADKQLVKVNGTAHDGYLTVGILSRKAKEADILLPVEAIETGSRWATVPVGALQTA